MKVYITRKIPSIAKEILLKSNFDVKEYTKDKPISKLELIKNARNSDAVISLLTDQFDKEVIDSIPKLKIISNYAVGFNNIDVHYAREKGIVVTNTPDILTDATADLASALVLACARNLIQSEKFMRERKFEGWKPKLFLGYELRNKTVGIIGAGRIGFETAKRLKSFGTDIIYYNRSRKEEFEKELNAKKVSLKKLMKSSDIISLHLPLNESTDNLINKDYLELMKHSAIFINTARGEIVDESCLIKMLQKGRIFAAGFDVYFGEPKVNTKIYNLKNAVILPHLGSATFEARNKMAELCAKNVINVLNNKKALTEVKV